MYKEAEPLGLMAEEMLTDYFTSVALHVRYLKETEYEIDYNENKRYLKILTARNSNISSVSEVGAQNVIGQMVELPVQYPAENSRTPPRFL